MNVRPNAPFRPPRPIRGVAVVQKVVKRKLPTTTNPKPAKILTTDPGSTKYVIQWRKKTSKKNKTWDGDGYAVIKQLENGACEISIKNSDGKPMGKRVFTATPNLDDVISVGSMN